MVQITPLQDFGTEMGGGGVMFTLRWAPTPNITVLDKRKFTLNM